MALVVPNIGETKLLEWILKSTGTDTVLKLYSNDYTPVAASTNGSFTEATFTGYVEKDIARTDWASATTNGSGKAEITSPDLSWSATSSQTVYGYFVQDASGNLLFAERFSSARALESGDTLTISPKFTLTSEA